MESMLTTVQVPEMTSIPVTGNWSLPEVTTPGHDVMRPPPAHPDVERLDNIRKTLMTVVYPLIIFPGLVGNGFSFAVMQSKQLEGKPCNFELAALAVVDSIVLLTGPGLTWLEGVVLKDHSFKLSTCHPAMCKLLQYALSTGAELSAWTLIFVTIERVIVVRRPLKASTILSKGRVRAIWCVLALALLIINIPYILYMELIEMFTPFDPSVAVLACVPPMHGTVAEFFSWNKLILAVLSPWYCMFIGNLIIIFTLVKRGRKMTEMTTSQKSDSTNVTRTLLVVTTLFLVLLAPMQVWVFYTRFFLGLPESPLDIAKVLFYDTLFKQIQYINYAINFVLYVVSGQTYRQAFLSIMKCQGQGSSITTNTARVMLESNSDNKSYTQDSE